MARGNIRNYLSGELEDPFPTIPQDVRARAEQLTGRTIEESYARFTASLLLDITNMELGRDYSKSAKKRHTDRRSY